MSVTKQVKDWLSRDIREGVYPPGSKMPTRMSLMKKYNISRASIDKVIGQLVEEEILTSSQGSGTYVIDKLKDEPHLFVILNTEVDCAEADSFHIELSETLNKVSDSMKHSIVASRDLEQHFSAIVQNNKSRVVWSRPSIKSYGFIANFDKAGIPQIIVNRVLSDYNTISTDTREALAEVFSLISQKHTQARFGLIAPPLDLEEVFLAEREIYFHQMIYEHSGQMNFMERVKSKSPTDVMETVRLAFDKVDQLDYLFVPDYSMVPLVVHLAAERNIRFGKDLTLITIDWQEQKEGIICIKQDWQTMLNQAVQWAKRQEQEKIQKLVPPQILSE